MPGTIAVSSFARSVVIFRSSPLRSRKSSRWSPRSSASRKHCAQRGFDPTSLETIGLSGTARWLADELGEGVAKGTRGFVPAVEAGREQISPLTDVCKGLTEALLALKGVKCHAEIPLKLPTGGRRVDT